MFRHVLLAIVGFLIVGRTALAGMSSANFEIRFDSIGPGGSDTSSSASYELRDTIGNMSPGISEGTNYQVSSGYRSGIFDQVIVFDVFGQQNSSERVATASAGNVISTDTGGLSVGDFIALVQDRGASQISAIGQIVSIGVGSITVDELKDGGVAPVIDGTNDYVYRLVGITGNFGTLETTSVSTSIIGMNVSADVDSGYSVQVFDDGDLRDGTNAINDVVDGTVTAGSEEYGGRSSDTTLSGSTFDTADTAFLVTAQDVADVSDAVFESRNFVTLKASKTGSTPNGSYAHQLSFVVSGNY